MSLRSFTAFKKSVEKLFVFKVPTAFLIFSNSFANPVSDKFRISSNVFLFVVSIVIFIFENSELLAVPKFISFLSFVVCVSDILSFKFLAEDVSVFELDEELLGFS